MTPTKIQTDTECIYEALETRLREVLSHAVFEEVEAEYGLGFNLLLEVIPHIDKSKRFQIMIPDDVRDGLEKFIAWLDLHPGTSWAYEFTSKDDLLYFTAENDLELVDMLTQAVQKLDLGG